MSKKIIILTIVFVFIYCNLLGDEREIIITLLPYDGDVHDCYVYLNSYEVYLEKVNETPGGDDIAVLRTYPVIYNMTYDNGIVTYPTIIHIELDYDDYPNGSTLAWAQGYVGFYYPDQSCYAIGNNTIYNNEVDVEITAENYPPQGYTYNETNLSSSGWNWVSFPVLDPDYVDPIDHVLEPILDDLDEVVHDQDYIYWTGTSWQNDIGDFQSIDGYKIQMDDDAELEVAGWVEDPDTEIPLYEEEENWIGYFIPYSQSPSWAFGDAWQYLKCIQAEDWSMYKKNGIWYGPAGVTMDYGDGYVVWVDDDCTLEWVCFGQMESYVKPESQYFSYEEKASYEAIDITGIDESVLEIGVFENDICVGASVVENGFAQILAYTENVNKEGSELAFQIVSGKGDKQEICNFYVYDFDKSTYIKRKLISGNQKYSLVTLNKGVQNQTHIELSLSQNIPNPFSSNTLISYSIPKESNVKISVYNLKGQRVKTLVNEILSVGSYSTVWYGTDDKGITLPNGVYFYKLDNDNTSISKKVIIMH